MTTKVALMAFRRWSCVQGRRLPPLRGGHRSEAQSLQVCTTEGRFLRGGYPPLEAFQLGWVKGGEEFAIFPSLVSFSFPLSLGQARERGLFPQCAGEENGPPRASAPTGGRKKGSQEGEEIAIFPLLCRSLSPFGQARERGSFLLFTGKENGPPGASAPTRPGRSTHSAASRPARGKTKEAGKKCRSLGRSLRKSIGT